MNGFEPVRRRVIDYTSAGQWTVVYDGPVEDCGAEKLKAENAKLRELVRELPTCSMEPDGWYGEEYGIYKCSRCGELWQFGCDGPKEHKWTCCPRCRSVIDYGEVDE